MSTSNLNRIFVAGIKFLLIVVVLDFVIGFIGRQLYFSQDSGKYFRITNTIYSDTSDVIVFGSSHVTRHYVPSVIKEELGLDCYNAGVKGQGILFATALQEIVLKRHRPELIILNLDQNWLYEEESMYGRLSDLYPYYWGFRDVLHEKMSLRSKLVDAQLASQTYQMNSTILHILNYNYKTQVDYNGYVPFYGKMKKPKDGTQIGQNVNVESGRELDANFENALKSFIKNAQNKDVEIVFALSPTLIGVELNTEKSLKRMLQIAKDNQVKVYDYSTDVDFIGNYELFHDIGHLNHQGAMLFSKKLAQKLSL